jgi:putative membrane protein
MMACAIAIVLRSRINVMAAFFSFLHFLGAFALVAALVVELVFIREELNVRNARRLVVADAIYGMSAGLVLIAGGLRVFFFEKGSAYYFASIPFLLKITLFFLIAAASIYPTFEFLKWYKPLKQGQPPSVSEDKRRLIRSLIHVELVAVLLLVLCAALMAKGIGYRG